jgi:predicted ATPase
LQRLALFTAGFTFSTAESACAWGEIQREDVLDLLSSLVSKSLVVAETLQGSEARYRLLVTIRQYAQEKLRASGDWVSAHDHCLACWLLFIEEVAPKLREQYQQLWFDWLETENDNIRAALAWALEEGRIEAGMRIGTVVDRPISLHVSSTLYDQSAGGTLTSTRYA